MKFVYIYIEKFEKLLEERKQAKIRIERIDNILERQAYNTISNIDVDDLNKESDDLEQKISNIDDKLEALFNQLKSLTEMIEKDIKELIEEDEKLKKRMHEIYSIVESPNKSYMNTYELNSFIKEYNNKKDRNKEVINLLEERKKDLEYVEKFFSKTELPRRRL